MKLIKFPYICLLIFSLSFFNTSKAVEKISYLDTVYLMNNSLAGKAIAKQLDNLNKKHIANFTKIENNIKLKNEKIIAQKNVINKTEFDKKVNEINKEIADYKNLRKKVNSEVSDIQKKAKMKLINKITEIIVAYADEKKLSLVFEKKSVIIGKTELDITLKIMSILNSKVKEIKL